MCTNQQRQESSIYWWPEAGKLIFLKEKATPEFWDRQWQTEDWEKKITRSRNSRYWHSILKKYLPNKKSRILEGGCGYGHLVDAMHYWGYDAIGIDFAPQTVAKIKEVMPNLHVRCGNVKALDFEDNYFDGYWSLGVIEHFREGYDDVLMEMKRVLKVGGYAFVIFPCISPMGLVENIFSRYKRFTGSDMPDNFYQFGLNADAVRKDFEHAGFQCVCARRRSGWEGLERVLPALERVHLALLRLSEKSRIIKLFTAGVDFLMAPLCGHGMLLVLRKQ